MKVRFLHTNDMHGKMSEVVCRELRGLRDKADFYFDSGDAIRTSNLGVPLTPDPVWPMLASLACTASVLGNRETHPLHAIFDKKIEGRAHPILCGNVATREGREVLPGHLVLPFEGGKIGVISTMVAMATPKMKTAAAWFCLWSNPIESAIRLARELRPRVDLLVAITHIGYSQDRILAEQCGDIDIIFGGHSHTVLPEPVKVNQTWIVQGGSHCRFAGVYEWSDGVLTGGLKPLSPIPSQS